MAKYDQRVPRENYSKSVAGFLAGNQIYDSDAAAVIKSRAHGPMSPQPVKWKCQLPWQLSWQFAWLQDV